MFTKAPHMATLIVLYMWCIDYIIMGTLGVRLHEVYSNFFFNMSLMYYFLMQKEKEVLSLLSRLDLQNVHFTNSPPGMSCS